MSNAVKYYNVIIRIEAEDENQVEETSNNIAKWIDETLREDNIYGDGSIHTEMTFYGRLEVCDKCKKLNSFKHR